MVPIEQPRVISGCNRKREPEAAFHEWTQAFDQADIGLVRICYSSTYEQARLSAAIRAHFSGATVVVCTTAVEIDPVGYHDGSQSGVSFHGDDPLFEVAILLNLSAFDSHAGQRFAQGVFLLAKNGCKATPKISIILLNETYSDQARITPYC